MLTLEHIDPRKGALVSGLENEFNEIIADATYNKSKNNRFVPYRVCDHPAPVTYGDIGEFLIEGEWVVCEFGGLTWLDESNRIGNSQINCAKLPASDLCKKKARERCRKLGAKSGPINCKKACAAAAIVKRKPVFLTLIETGDEFEFASQIDACRAFNLSPGCVSMVLSGQLKKHKGFYIRRTQWNYSRMSHK